ncbi:MAG: efflux RND transporter permease subunit, partial [Desulfobacterales bacterium]|nr:efflux RND transporter permease subunit [Desulfobacterales bacterium]
MGGISAWFTRNPVAANLLALLVIVGGLFTLAGIRIEGFPSIPPSTISIDITYTDATAEQVDSGVSRKVEKALEGLAGIKKVTSFSSENFSQVMVKKETGYDMLRLLNDVKTRVDGIDNLPAKSEKPVIYVDEYKDFGLLVQAYGDVDQHTLQSASRLIQRELQAHPRISKVATFGKLNREMRIELDGERLKSLGLSMNQVARIVQANRSESGFGRLKNNGNAITIRSDVKLEYPSQLMDLPLVTRADGSKVFIRDVARIIDGYEDKDELTRYQGQDSVGIVIYTSKRGHLLQVSEAAHQVVEGLRSQMPPGVKIDLWADMSIYMKNRLNLLQSNAWQGLGIVFVILALFLNVRLAFWVAMGIPFSIAGAVALMGPGFLDYSLNDITTFGMIVVLGILVDDAVVVGESIFEERQKVADPIQGTIQGVNKVAVATIFGVLTTVAAFFPITLIKNDFGKILASFSVVVCVALLFSLVESKLVLPAHLAHTSVVGQKPRNPVLGIFYGCQQWASRSLEYVCLRFYTPVLKWVLRHRYTCLVLFITLALTSGWLVKMGYVRSVFFPEIPGDVVQVTATMEKGSTAGKTLAHAHVIEQVARDLNVKFMDEFKSDKPPIRRIMTSVEGAKTITLYAELQPQENRVV